MATAIKSTLQVLGVIFYIICWVEIIEDAEEKGLILVFAGAHFIALIVAITWAAGLW